jgi:hypothetical protein
LTTTVSVVVWVSVPALEEDVPVIVMVLVPAGVPGFCPGVEEELEEPQPVRLSPTPRRRTTPGSVARRPRRRRIAMSGAPSTSKPKRDRFAFSAGRAVVLTVTVAVAFAAPGVTLAGDTVQVDAEGAPEQEKVMAEAKPPEPGVTVRVAVLPVVAPAVNEMLAGVLSAKSEMVTGVVAEVAALKTLEPG